LKKDSDAERIVRGAFDAAALNPKDKTIDVFVACGNDGTVNAGIAAAVVRWPSLAVLRAKCLLTVPAT
jgi:diacylglycerol kinase family enzyme